MVKSTPDTAEYSPIYHDFPEKPFKKNLREEDPIPFSDLQGKEDFRNPDPIAARQFSMEPGVSALDFLSATQSGETISEAVARILREHEEAKARQWREAIDGLVAQRNLIDSMFAVGIDVQFPTLTVPQKPGWQPDGNFALPNGTVLRNTDRDQDDKDSGRLFDGFKTRREKPKFPEPKLEHEENTELNAVLGEWGMQRSLDAAWAALPPLRLGTRNDRMAHKSLQKYVDRGGMALADGSVEMPDGTVHYSDGTSFFPNKAKKYRENLSIFDGLEPKGEWHIDDGLFPKPAKIEKPRYLDEEPDKRYFGDH